MLDGDGVVVVVVGVLVVFAAEPPEDDPLLELDLLAEPDPLPEPPEPPPEPPEPPPEGVRDGTVTVTVRVGVLGLDGVGGLRGAFTSETNSLVEEPDVLRLADCALPLDPLPDPPEPAPPEPEPVAVPFSTSVS